MTTDADASSPAPPPKPPRRWTFRRLLLLGGGLFVFYLFAIWPPPLWYAVNFPKETAFQAMRRRENPAEAASRKYEPVPLNRIAPGLKKAVLVAEDHRFYEHGGLDYVEMRKAIGYPRDSFALSSARDRADLRRAVDRLWSKRSSVRGASTITQQLAKNLYLSPSRNPLRKVKEAITAWRLELWLSKERILELYLNTAEMGDEIWGAEAASQVYFRRPASQLTLPQAATLAALLPFPRSSNPYYRPGRMNWRKNFILRRLGGERIEVPIDSEPARPEPPPLIIPPPDTQPPDSLRP